MRKLTALLGYSAAILVLALLFLTPFKLLDGFTGLVGRLGIQPHPKFAGGPVARTLARGSHRIEISAPDGTVGPLERSPRFVQVAWSPASALPGRIQEDLDLDGDETPEVSVDFEVPQDRNHRLQARVQVLDPAKVRPIQELGRTDLSALLVRLEDRIVARFPVP